MKKNNPIIKGMGVCDPHIHIFNNTAYLYASHDISVDNKTWLMSDWQIWSSKDLITWNYERTVRPEDSYIGKCERCWAVDAAQKNGKYYYYFSNGNKETGAAVGNDPSGPFRDALGKPLLAENLTQSKQYDPTVFIDPDNDIPYIIWGCGDGNGYYIAMLNEDMISLAETPRRILIDDKPARDDKNFLHKKNGVYYLSWGSFYATSDSVYGPYAYRGNLVISEDHGSFFSWNGQDFYAFTIFDPSCYYRATGICYIHYKANGEMAADPLIGEYGVGAYDSNWDKIQAVWFMKGKAVQKKESIWGGFDAAGINNESELFFPNIKNIKNKTKIHFLAESIIDESFIEIFDSNAGKQIGRCKLTKDKAFNHFKHGLYSCDLSIADNKGKLDMKLCFRGHGGEIMKIHWFKFT